jgi:hypothetical protein
LLCTLAKGEIAGRALNAKVVFFNQSGSY